MSQSIKTLKQLKKCATLTNRTFHKNGPKSFKKGQGALLKVLHRAGGEMTSSELIDRLSFNRKQLKEIVRKAEKAGYVTIGDASEKRTYLVKLTSEGEELAEKRCAAQSETADAIVSVLSEEELEQLNSLTEKIILQCKELGAHGKKKNCSKGHHRHHHGQGHCKKHHHRH